MRIDVHAHYFSAEYLDLLDRSGGVESTTSPGRRCLWPTTKDWASKNAATVKQFVKAMHDIAQWSNTHHDESAPILAKYSKIPVETIAHMRRGNFVERFDPALIQPVIDAAAHYGVIAAPFRASDIIFGAS